MQQAHVASRRLSVKPTIERVADSPWGDRLLRIGLAARGIVFLIFAYLVVRVALGALGQGSTSKPASLMGVPQALAEQTGGRAVLFVLAVGLVMYALFSLVDATLHHDDEQPAGKKWGDRALSAWGFVMYCGFSAYCFVTAVSASGGQKTSGQEDRQKAQWSAKVLRWPVGWLWLGLLAGILLIIAGFLVSRAARRSFRPRLEKDRMSPRAWRYAMVLGTAGYLGRAGLFGIVGGCIMSAAIENDPSNGQGVNGSVRLISDDAVGVAGLAVLAALLVAYGSYMFVETRYRRV